ncbi:hypothetical protein M9Y10_022469 [Tritrichomonas musculus]|uniref:Protein kinase domain-containing protein n=1 Tax=Tritrichomonas musculus TaxID=1915356 RepID=A0ABR2KSC4_9EUKA
MTSSGIFIKFLVDISEFTISNDIIGSGTFGVVKKGKSPKKNNQKETECAIKYIKADKIKTRDDHEKLINEIRCQTKLNYIGIMPLIGYSIPFMGIGSYTIITPFMPNGSLSSLIQEVSIGNSPENWETIKAINIFGIAAGMAYVHQNGIIHRDLKTENVMLDENYLPKIADFGLSRVFQKDTEEKTIMTVGVGTPIYMAPELFLEDHYTNKIDVFAYAIILYEILTQNKPYYEKENLSQYQIFRDVSQGLRPKIRQHEISNNFANLIENCWAQDPDLRPSFIKIVKDFLDHVSDYFDINIIDEIFFNDYIEQATKSLDFSVLVNKKNI